MGGVHGVGGSEVCNVPSSAGGAGTIGTTSESEPVAANPGVVEGVVGAGVEIPVEPDGEVEVEVLGGVEAGTVTAVGTVVAVVAVVAGIVAVVAGVVVAVAT